MRTIEEVKKIAIDNGWQLNPDTKVVIAVIKGQNMAFEKLGNYYCPCKRQKTAENICPCKNSNNEIEKDGHCHCNLFYKKTE